MKKVLIYYPKNKLGMSDFGSVDYRTLGTRVNQELNGIFPNVGNKVWLQGITSAITTEKITYEFGYEEISEDIINTTYDCVLLPLANCFDIGWMKYMRLRTEHIKKIKIPVYVIACGVQANSYDDLNKLVETIREPASEFIHAVYNTGGQFALRGYFTAEFFSKLGFNDAVVTGCPSLFQMGRNLLISNEKVDRRDFVATINGSFKLPIKKSDIEKSHFICQSTYGNFLYNPEYFKNNPFTMRKILRDIRRDDYQIERAIVDGRIHLFADLQQWMDYFIQNKISFSFGSRIHGTIMPILSGVPSLLYACDARTKEMAEFFDIPYIEPKAVCEKQDLYELYKNTDYTSFNMNFEKRYNDYENFLRKCGLVDDINQINIYMSRENTNRVSPEIINQDKINEVSKFIKRYNLLFEAVDVYYNGFGKRR